MRYIWGIHNLYRTPSAILFPEGYHFPPLSPDPPNDRFERFLVEGIISGGFNGYFPSFVISYIIITISTFNLQPKFKLI